MEKISLKEFIEIDNGLLYQEYLHEDKQIYDKMYHQFFAQELIDSCNKHEIFLMTSFPIDKSGTQILIGLYLKVETWLITNMDIRSYIVPLRKDIHFRLLIKFLIYLEKNLQPHP